MEQRPPRLGDIVDDYCPRERRVTNHAVVAIVEEAIRQTRCTTCDTEHVFKGGHEPRRRLVKPALVPSEAAVVEVTSAQLVAVVDTEPPAAASDPAQAATSLDPQGAAEPVVTDAWLAHRRLIRATLPRTAADPPPPRPIPEFTMHQRQPQARHGRPFRFNHSGQGSPGPSFRGRPAHGHGNSAAGDDDEVNGNVSGPSGNGHAGPNGPAGPGGHAGRRRRGRRRRGR